MAARVVEPEQQPEEEHGGQEGDGVVAEMVRVALNSPPSCQRKRKSRHQNNQNQNRRYPTAVVAGCRRKNSSSSSSRINVQVGHGFFPQEADPRQVDEHQRARLKLQWRGWRSSFPSRTNVTIHELLLGSPASVYGGTKTIAVRTPCWTFL